MTKGKFIIFEGTDGSGKTTQFNLAEKYFTQKGYKVRTMDFPQYDQFWGKVVGRFLAGEFGDLDQVSPYLIASIYSLDQVTQTKKIRTWLDEGDIVLSNRYVTSTMGHQAAKFSDQKERQKFLKWFKQAAYQELRAIKEDLTIVLYANTDITTKNAQQDQDRKSEYNEGKIDIAENDLVHQTTSAEVYSQLANSEPTWGLIDCMLGENIASIDSIHQKVIQLIENRLNI